MGSRMVRGLGRRQAALCSSWDKVVDESVVVLGSFLGTVQLLDKGADVPVAVPLVVFEVFSQDGLSSVLLNRSSTRRGTRC